MDTLPKLLLANAQKWGHRRPAIREKEYGIWQTQSWAAYAENVRDLALGLAALGFQRGDKLAIMGVNRPEMYWAMLAAQSLGGVPVPLFHDALPAEVQHLLDHCEAKIVLAETQEQVDKVLAVREGLPKLERLIYDDPRGMRKYTDPILIALAKVQEMGRQFREQQPHYFEQQVEATRPDDVAIISYRYDMAGVARGVMLTHRNLLANVENVLQVDALRPNDELMAFLPIAWLDDTFWSLAVALKVGCTINIPEEPDTLPRDLREIGPTSLVAPPRVWENLLAIIRVRVEDADIVKKSLYNYFLGLAQRMEEQRSAGRSPSLLQSLLYKIGDFLVYAPIKDHLGIRRLRFAYSGYAGGLLAPEIFSYFRALGVNLKQSYGLPEAATIVTVHRDGDVRSDTVGKPLPGVEVTISPEGEVLVRSEGVFQGYYRDPEATAAARSDGWLRTGDAGEFTEAGHLFILDRLAHVAKLADGSTFAPLWVESRLKYSPYIREAVAVGAGRPHVAALIVIDSENVARWAERHGLGHLAPEELVRHEAVQRLVHEEVRRVNQGLAASTRVQRFVILPRDWRPGDEEVTRSGQVRRDVVLKKYASLIEALYTDATSAELVTSVTYEDGRKAELRTQVSLITVQAPEEIGVAG